MTEAGRLLALGAHDPGARWKRRWDGKWRMVLFDVPQSKASERARLRRSLADRGFGYLQNSVWITPDPLTGEREALGTGPANVASLILLEACPCAGESDAEIVAGAWDFDAINKCYERHAQVDGTCTKLCLVRDKVLYVVAAGGLRAWTSPRTAHRDARNEMARPLSKYLQASAS